MSKIDIYNQEYDMFNLHSSKNSSVFSINEKKYNGDLLLREIALFAGAHQRSTKLFLTIAITGKLSLPFVARYYQFGIFTLEWDSAIYTAFEMIALTFFLLQNYFFLAAGYVDFQRRLFMIKSVGALINPFKNLYDVKYQLLPTINLLSTENINAWFQLRSCIMDFGRKYIMRVFMYSSVFLALYLFITVMLLLSFFGFISIKFSFFF